MGLKNDSQKAEEKCDNANRIGLNAGRNSILAISKQIVTKFKRGVIRRITGTTFCKMFNYELYNNSLSAILEGII